LFVLVVIVALESGAGSHHSRVLLDVNFCGVIILITIACSNEASLFRNEFVIMFRLISLIFPSKSGHSEIECVHGPTHGIDEHWLILVDKAIDLVGILFNLLSLLDHLGVGVMRLDILARPLPIIPLVFVHAPKVNALFILELLHVESLVDSVTQRLLVVRLVLILLLGVHLGGLVAHLDVLGRFYMGMRKKEKHLP
jgi:hypothetical protein